MNTLKNKYLDIEKRGAMVRLTKEEMYFYSTPPMIIQGVKIADDGESVLIRIFHPNLPKVKDGDSYPFYPIDELKKLCF